MRASVASLSKKFISAFFAATLALGLVPAAAFAVDDNGAEAPENSGAADAARINTEDLVISSEGDEVPEVEKSAPIEQNEGEALTNSSGEDAMMSNATGSDDAMSIPAATERINETMVLQTRTVAQAESTRSYFLAQTLESTRTVPIVSANLPLDTGNDEASEEEGAEEGDDPDGEGDAAPVDASFSLRPPNADFAVSAESTVIGSFEYRGITYAVEPGGETVAVVAADYDKFPTEFIEAQSIVLPSAVTHDGIDYYSMTRIADHAFSSMTLQNDVEGITAITIPASVTSIGDDAFTGFDTLQYVIVSDDNPVYSMYDGALYDADQTSLLLIPEGRLGAVRIAPSVTEIDPEVFSHCPSVDTLVADPDSAAYQLLSENGTINGSNNILESESFILNDESVSIDYSMRFGEENIHELTAILDGFAQGEGLAACSNGAAVMASDVITNEDCTILLRSRSEPFSYCAIDLAKSSDQGSYLNRLSQSASDRAFYLGTSFYSTFNGEFFSGLTMLPSEQLQPGEEQSTAVVGAESGPAYVFQWSNNQQYHPTIEFDSERGYYLYRPSFWPRKYFVCLSRKVVSVSATEFGPDIPAGDELGFYNTIYFRDYSTSVIARWLPNGGFWSPGNSENRTTDVSAMPDGKTPYTFKVPDAPSIPPNPTSIFDGWLGDDGVTVLWPGETTTQTVAQKYLAQWAESHVVTLDPVKGSGGTDSFRMYDQRMPAPAAKEITMPVRVGYKFEGFYLPTEDGREFWYSIDQSGKLVRNNATIESHYPLTSDVTLKAQWSRDIALDAQGGAPDQIVVATWDGALPDALGETSASIAVPKKAGYVFAGYWSKQDDGEQYYEAKSGIVMPVAGKTWNLEQDRLYAQWLADIYRIDLVVQDPKGEIVNHPSWPNGMIESIADVPYKSSLASLGGDDYVLKTVGYEFLGWSTNQDATEVDSTFLFNGKGEGLGTYETAGNTMVYSVWKPCTVKVVFDPNASGIDEVETVQTFNQNLKDVPAFHRFGYELDGWYRNEAGTIGEMNTSAAFRPSKEDLKATEGIVYFAKWTPVTYAVTLYPGEHGSYSSEATDAVADGGVRGGYKIVHDYTVEEKEWSFVRPKAEGGYRFAGWQQLKGDAWVDCAGFVDPDSFRAGPELAFQAKWTASEATVTLNLNGAPASEQAPGFSDTLTYSIDHEAVLPIPLWEGHTFLGWKLIERGGEEVDPAEDVTAIKGVAGTVPEDVVCEAQWVADTYTVRFLRSSAYPTEIAPSQTVGRDDGIVFVQPSFTQAFDTDRSENQARIFTNYKIEKVKAGTGKDVLFYPGDEPVSIGELMKAYPNLLDSKDRTPQNGSTIVFYADWEHNYSVVVPLRASIAFDPERIAEDPASALKPGSVVMKLLDPDASPVEVVSLICEPTLSTKTAFDDSKGFYDHAYLTLSAKQRSTEETSTIPVELNLGAAIKKGFLSVRDVKHPSTANVLSLPEIGFTFGGAKADDRILDLTFGIRFDSSVDPSNLSFLNAPSFKNTGNTIDLANVYYTLAMKR